MLEWLLGGLAAALGLLFAFVGLLAASEEAKERQGGWD